MTPTIKKKDHLNKSDESIVLNFRENQYQHLTYFLINSLNYIKNIGIDLILQDYKIIEKTESVYSYSSKGTTELFKYKINYILNNKLMNFLELSIPRLIEGIFFKISGNYYIPQYFFNDYPIIKTSNSFKINSTFCPLYLSLNPEYREFINIYSKKVDYFYFLNAIGYLNTISDSETIFYFNNFFKRTFDKKHTLTEFLNNLFFDDFTKLLYKKIYNIESLKDIIHYIENMDDIKYDFNDLNVKRLVFIETLYSRFFRYIVSIVHGYLFEDNRKLYYLNTSETSLTDSFIDDLSGQNYYKIINSYSSFLNQKSSFKMVGMKVVPSDIMSVHQTHYGKICPISISAKSPGEIVMISPYIKVDSLTGILL